MYDTAPIVSLSVCSQKKGLSHIAYFGNKLSYDELPSEGQLGIKTKIPYHDLEVEEQNYSLESIRTKPPNTVAYTQT